MTGIQWAEEMPESGRLAQSKRARKEGVIRVCDPRSSCNQTQYFGMFFDGTNNKDDVENPWPDPFRAALDIDRLNGHFKFAADDALNVTDKARYCHHAFSIHEQRMSFPLDAIRNGKALS